VLEFRILGPFEVLEDDRRLVLGGPRQRALLAILLLHRGEVVSSDRLIDELWGERPPATAAKTLQGYVSHLRKALGDGLLVTRGGGYVLQADDVDADRFAALVEEARSADARRARERLGSALELWRGEPLADLAYEPFAQAEVARLREERLGALEDLVDADLALGRHVAVVGELEALVAKHPGRERLLAQLMLALYRCGRQADALEAYRRGRRTLHDELGLEPGPELQALERQILNHDGALTAKATPRVVPRGRPLIAIGGALLVGAAIAAGVVALMGSGATPQFAAPNSVAEIDAKTDRVVRTGTVGVRPLAVAYGAGSLWVANLDDETISRVDPRTLRQLHTIPVGEPPTGVAIADRAVWVASAVPGRTSVHVRRIDPQFDALGRPRRLSDVVAGSAAAIAAGDRTLWVAPYAGPLARLDPRTGRVTGRRIDPNAAPTALVAGAGAAWMTDTDGGNVARVDPTGLVSSIPVGQRPSGIAVGYGAVWVADAGDDAVVRIDLDTRHVTTTIPVGRSPAGVAVGAGSVWVADSGDGTVTRIDPGRAKRVATIHVGGSPQAVAVDGGRVWVTVDAPALPAVPAGARGGTVRLVSHEDVTGMDPAIAYDPLAWQLLYATCAKLLNYPDRAGPAGSVLVPEVAQSLPTRSADGRTYTFTIRNGFRFSPPSNAPVTAQTFKATIERTLNPRMRMPIASDFGDIVGARAYMAGKAAHIAGVRAHGDKLTVRLTAPAPDVLARLADPFFCAVPPDTPIRPQGIATIPSAGPYRVASYTPRQGVVLVRNPNYHGGRPHRPARIEMAIGVPPHRAVAQVLSGDADYAVDFSVGPSDARRLAGRRGYFVNPVQALNFILLNSQRPLFADVRMRRAVNYAIDRAALARNGPGTGLPDRVTDHYLPPGIPGYRAVRAYPRRPDLVKARRLARGHRGATVVLYICEGDPTCAAQGQIVKDGLAAIGLRVEIKAFPPNTLYAKEGPGGRFDMAFASWGADYLDPDNFLNALTDGTVNPALADPAYRARLRRAARLTGPERYLTYGRLDLDLARNAAPFVAWGTASAHELFSARTGCQVYQPIYGFDLAALCLRR
jgi:YVTN family beta-propeller protein